MHYARWPSMYQLADNNSFFVVDAIYVDVFDVAVDSREPPSSFCGLALAFQKSFDVFLENVDGCLLGVGHEKRLDVELEVDFVSIQH